MCYDKKNLNLQNYVRNYEFSNLIYNNVGRMVKLVDINTSAVLKLHRRDKFAPLAKNYTLYYLRVHDEAAL